MPNLGVNASACRSAPRVQPPASREATGAAGRALQTVRNVASKAEGVARDPMRAFQGGVGRVLSGARPVDARVVVRAAGDPVLDARVHSGSQAQQRAGAIGLTIEPGNLHLRAPAPSRYPALVVDAIRHPLRALPTLLPDLAADVDVTVFPETHQRGGGEAQPVCSVMAHLDVGRPDAKDSDGVPLSFAVAMWSPGHLEARIAAQWHDIMEEPGAVSFAAFLQKLAREDEASATTDASFRADVAAWLAELRRDPALRSATFAASVDATRPGQPAVQAWLDMQRLRTAVRRLADRP